MGEVTLNRLILVEGLPGTGKTTISKWLSDLFAEKGEATVLLTEGDERIPCDFYNTAGIPKSDFESLFSNSPSERDRLMDIALQTKNYIFLRIDKCPAHIARKIKRWDIGDGNNQAVTAADYMPCVLERLQYWVKANLDNSEIVIIDSGFLQNPINELLFRHASNDQVRELISAIADLLKPLNPICVYLRRGNAEQAIDFAKMVKGKGWEDRVDKLLKQTNCEDLFLQRFELELELLPKVENLICHVYDDDWNEAKKLIQNYFTI